MMFCVVSTRQEIILDRRKHDPNISINLTMKLLVLLSLLGLSILSVSCSTTRASGESVRKVPGKVAYLSSDRSLDSHKIHNAITRELQQRGYKVIDKGSTPPQSKVNGIVVRYMDVWSWDVVMYLRSLDIKILDGRNSQILSMSNFKNGFFHSFPNSEKVVNKLFTEFDNKGTF